MRLLPLGFVLVGLCLAERSLLADSPTDPSATPQTTEELEYQIKQVLDQTNTPGAGLVIVSRDGIVWNTAIGLADRDSQRPVTPDTMFRAGSISKSFTAMGILKLQEAGRLKLDDPLRSLAPEVQYFNPWEDSQPVRLVHLLEHTAGFDEVRLSQLGRSIPDSRLSDHINLDPRPRTSRWPPGKFFSYSNADYTVAGYVLETVSDQSFDDFMTSELLNPLEMQEASFLLTDSVRQQLATGYGPDGVVPREYEHIVSRPAGALNCTPLELAHLVQMLLNRGTYQGKRILSANSINRMETPSTSVIARLGIRDGYGLGNFTTVYKGHRIHGHLGGMNGYLSTYGYSPEHGLGYVLMLNSVSGEALDRSEKLILSYLTRDWPQPIHPPVSPADEGTTRFAGFYEPHTPRLEQSRFLMRLLGLNRISFDNGELRIQGLLGQPETYLAGELAGSFRRVEDPGPSLLFFEDNGETFAASTDVFAGNFRRIPSWQFWVQSIGLLFCTLAMVSALAFAMVWIPRKLLGYLRNERALSVRVLPFLAVLSLVSIVAIFVCMTDPIKMLATPTVWSVGLCASTWMFALLTFASFVRLIVARRADMNRWVWRHSFVVFLANAIVLIYLSYWSIIGIRTWA
jgi:CubicO group peptidase (beta-lactamase class C family)